MRVLQVTIYGERKFGGPPQKIFALSDGLCERGHSVHIAAFHSDFRGGKAPEKQGLATIHFLSWKGRELWQWPTKWRRLRRLIRQSDVVHLYGLYNLLCPLAAILAKLERKPWVLEPLGMFVPRARSVRGKAIYNRFVTAPMARGASRVIATSPRELEELSALVPSEKLLLRRNGLDLSDFENLPSGEAFRTRFGIGADEKIVLYIGRISPIKNLEELVRAFSLLNLDKARLALVGPELEPEYAVSLRATIDELGLGERVILTGELYESDKLSALSSATAFVLPSTYESYGNAAAEAVAAGVPVLLTSGCGIAPHINGRAGLRVEPDAASLADGLSRLLSDANSFCARRGEVISELSWDGPLDQTEDFYKGVTKLLRG